MKTSVHKNSVDCYHEVVKDNLEIIEDELVLQAFIKIGAATGKMVSIETGIVPGQVSRVIGKLKTDNKILFIGSDKCKESKIKAQYFIVPQPNQQLPLFP